VISPSVGSLLIPELIVWLIPDIECQEFKKALVGKKAYFLTGKMADVYRKMVSL
jgi:hypothetical protein